MQHMMPLACFLSMIRPPGVEFENALLQISPKDKVKCPFVRDKNDVGFQLFTRHNPTVHQDLAVGDDERLFASNINFNDPTVIFFHAFMENPDDGSGVLVRQAYMLRGDTNVIMVDAATLEAGPWYFTAAENTWYIGRLAAQFIDYLVSRGLDLSKTHLVGHSLGAQSAGVAGAHLHSGRVARITGLDPALPLFDKLPLEQRLDPSDAHFVDVIHTDAGIFGYPSPIGHADFYPNGGISPQPGCELEVVIPQQLLLNKCENRTLGFYTYHLKSTQNKHTHKTKLHSKLQKAFDKAKIKPNQKLFKQARKNKNEEINKPILFKVKEERNTLESILNPITNTENFNLLNIGDTQAIAQENLDYKPVNEVNNKIEVNNEIDKEDLDSIFKSLFDENNDQIAQETNDFDEKVKLIEAIVKTLIEINRESEIDFTERSHVKKRQKRFVSLFKRSEAEESNNFLLKMLEFLLKNRRTVVPVFTVMREINTLVKSANGELNHSTKERNNYIGSPPVLTPVTYNLELGNESKAQAFVKRLLGMAPKGDRLTISGTGK